MPHSITTTPEGNNQHAVVIGAGFSGIATALRLRSLGYRVTLMERLGSLGGRAQVFNRGGYKHDAGPTVITAPFLFDELFELFDEKLEDHLDFVPLDPFYRFHFTDGSQFDYRASIEDTLDEIRRFSPADADGYLKLLDQSKKVYDIGFKKLVHRPFNSLWLMVKQIPALLTLKCYKTVSQLVGRYLKHPKIQQAFSIHPLLVGGNPFKTTAIYTLIHYLERRWGVFFCMGGTGKLVQELGALMERQGIEIVLNADVDEILTQENLATGVRMADGKTLDADIVVPVPDSGNAAALGFAQNLKINFELGLIRNHYVGRTFIEPSQKIRSLGVKLKLNANKSTIKDKKIILIDDSLVRGTTSHKIVKMLYDAGAKEVHVKIACPEIKYPDFYGVDTPTKKELLAANKTNDEICEYIGAKSLKFLSLDGMYKAIGFEKRNDSYPQLTDHYFTGDYPVKLIDELNDNKVTQLSLLSSASNN